MILRSSRRGLESFGRNRTGSHLTASRSLDGRGPGDPIEQIHRGRFKKIYHVDSAKPESFVRFP